MPTTQFHTVVVSDLAKLNALEADWSKIVANSDHRTTAFQSFAFCRTFAVRCLAANPKRRLHVVAVYDRDQNLSLIVPMTVAKRAGVVVAEWLGEPAIQYADIIGLPTPDDDAMAAAIMAPGLYGVPDLFDFRRIRQDALIAPWLERCGRPTGIGDEGPYIDLTLDDKDLPFQSGKKKKDRRRKRRKIDQRGNVQFEIARSGERAAELMSQALDLKLKWLDEKGLVSRALSQEWVRSALIDLAANSTDTIISAFSVDGSIASISVGFIENNVYYAYLGVINYEFAEASPGDLLTDHDIKWCQANNIERFDYLPPLQRYKQSWTTGTTTVTNYDIARSWRGKIYARLLVGLAEPLLKSAFHSLPDPLRRAVQAAFNKVRG